MRRMLLAAIAVVGTTAAAQANWGSPPMPQQAAPAAAPTNMYGWNQRLLWWKKSPCGTKNNCGAAGYGAGAGAGAGEGTPGTLVFPQHPFVRSPRDYFMYEGK